MRILAILLVSLLPLPAGAAATQPTLNQKCDALLSQWRAKLDSERFSYIVSPPFVLAGDGGEVKLQGYLDHNIVASADAMHRQFFQARPSQPILILLFESEKPYRRLAKQWFGDENVSHYGYFRHNNVMVMNVGTGTGTLVHELTHALMRADFPGVPDWFNEGLASLFEQCTLADGKIRGLANWRLAGLQRAIRNDKLRPLAEMIGDKDFYAQSNVALNYAQARYLLMYLQEQGELESFYKQLRANHRDDPTGLRTLAQFVAPQPIDDFDQTWRKWVMTLKFP